MNFDKCDTEWRLIGIENNHLFLVLNTDGLAPTIRAHFSLFDDVTLKACVDHAEDGWKEKMLIGMRVRVERLTGKQSLSWMCLSRHTVPKAVVDAKLDALAAETERLGLYDK